MKGDGKEERQGGDYTCWIHYFQSRPCCLLCYRGVFLILYFHFKYDLLRNEGKTGKKDTWQEGWKGVESLQSSLLNTNLAPDFLWFQFVVGTDYVVSCYSKRRVKCIYSCLLFITKRKCKNIRKASYGHCFTSCY